MPSKCFKAKNCFISTLNSFVSMTLKLEQKLPKRYSLYNYAKFNIPLPLFGGGGIRNQIKGLAALNKCQGILWKNQIPTVPLNLNHASGIIQNDFFAPRLKLFLGLKFVEFSGI